MVRGLADAGITLRLTVEAGRVVAVQVAGARPAAIGAVLVGRAAAEAAALVPRLFALCAEAQGAAALAAVRAAGGERTALDAGARRRVLAEMLLNHGWASLADWPRRLGEAPDAAGLARLRAATTALRDTPSPDAAAAVQAALHGTVLGPRGLPESPEELAAWAEAAATPAARLLRLVLREGLAGFGASAVPPQPPLPAEWFAARLAAQAAGAAPGPPPDDGPAESGAAARLAGDAVLAALRARHGGGLLLRLAARLREMAALPARILAADPAALPPPAGGAGEGCGLAETARGRLAHWCRLEQGRVVAWASTTPTEGNFHPQGAAVQGLLGVADGPALERDAALHAASLDPCLPCRILVERG